MPTPTDNNNNNKSESSSEIVPPQILAAIHNLITGLGPNEKLNLQEPHMKKSLENIAVYIVIAYGTLILYGVLANLYLIGYVVRYRLYKDPTYSFIINNAIGDIIKCVVVLPITLYVLLIQNWMLGELLCMFLPMLQDIPLHVTMLNYIFLAWDRYRYLKDPTTSRLPAFVCTVGTWLSSICLVLPYPIYITHIDLGEYLDYAKYQGVGLCIVNLADDMKEYMRGIFLVTYAGPLAAISYFFICASRELTYNNTPAVIFYESRGGSSRASRSRVNSHSTVAGDISRSNPYSPAGSFRDHDLDSYRTRYEIHEPDLDMEKERRTQKYLIAITSTYGICVLPLMIIRLARLILVETYENSSHFDYTYIIFVWIAFLPCCLTPPIFACWQMSRSSRERLKGYFRFSNRRIHRPNNNNKRKRSTINSTITTTTTTTTANPRFSFLQPGRSSNQNEFEHNQEDGLSNRTNMSVVQQEEDCVGGSPSSF